MTLPAVAAASASSFVNSLGINMNISDWTSEANLNLAADENALSYLGIKMIRSTPYSVNMAAYTQLNKDLGIKYDFEVNGTSTAQFNETLQLIKANAGIVDFVEGQNESDEPGETANYDGLTGLAATAAEQAALYAAIKSDPQTASIGVIQASFGIPASFAAYGDQAGTADYTNSHIYYNFFPFGTDPMHRNALWMKTLLADAQSVTPGVPNIVTETGYETLAGSGCAVSLIDQAKYMLDDVFDLWNEGVVKSFIFMLVDTGPSSPDPTNFRNSYGVYNADWTPKPAAIALHNLMTLLADPGTGGVAPSSLSYTLTGEPSTVYTTLLEKSDGTFVLAIWNDVQLQNTAGVDTPVAAVAVTLTLANVFESITIYDPLTGTSAVQSYADASTIQIMVPDHPILIEISNSAPAATVTAANVPVINDPNTVLVAPGAIVQVGGVSVGNDQLGLIKVQVSDSYGKLQMRDANGQTLSGSGTDSITLSGSAAIVNAELATLAYTAAGAGGGDAISLQVTGAAGTTQSDFITVTSIKRPALSHSIGPLLSVPGTLTVGTGTRVAIADAVLTDDYYTANPGNLTLTVSAVSGELQMQANGTELAAAQSLTVSGSYAAIIADLASLTYQSASKVGADTLTFVVTDAGGYTTKPTMAIDVTWDLLIDGPGATSVAAGASEKFAVQIVDAQKAGNADQLQLTVSDLTGTLSMLDSNGNPLSGSGGHSISVSGTPDQINSELATLVEKAASSAAADTVTISVSDSEGSATSSSFSVNVTGSGSTGGAPVLAVAAPASLAATARMVLPVTGVAVSDSHIAAGGVQETVVVTDKYGKLSMINSAGTVVAGSGGQSITLTGSLAVVNAELATLTYTAPAGTGTDSIAIAASDSAGATSSRSIPVAFTPYGTLPAYFQLADTAGDPLSRQSYLSSGATVLTTAATGLNGGVSEQVSGGVFTLSAQAWNTVFSATVTDLTNTSSSYVLNNFRSANANLSAGPTATGQAQTLTINTAQSGSIILGKGNQNVVINAGLGGATTSSNNGFNITEGSGTDALTVNGYAGYLPSSNVADITNVMVTGGAGTETMNFIDAYATVKAGSGNLTIYGSNNGTGVTAGSGTANIWGGTGVNDFVYHTGDGLMTIEDFAANDTLYLDKSLQAGMTQKAVTGGIELLFSSSPHSEILLKGQTANLTSHLIWR